MRYSWFDSTTDYIYMKGGLAQLARASALHAEGHRFDSDILHIKEICRIGGKRCVQP